MNKHDDCKDKPYVLVLQSRINELEAERQELQSDYEALLKHHELTDDIIKDAQGLRPSTGRALLHTLDSLKARNIELTRTVECQKLQLSAWEDSARQLVGRITRKLNNHE